MLAFHHLVALVVIERLRRVLPFGAQRAPELFSKGNINSCCIAASVETCSLSAL